MNALKLWLVYIYMYIYTHTYIHTFMKREAWLWLSRKPKHVALVYYNEVLFIDWLFYCYVIEISIRASTSYTKKESN
jgi:hypothetical protein